MWYVYILYDPRNDRPFYVGKGKKKRLKATVNPNQNNNHLKKKFIKEMSLVGLEPRVNIIAEYELEEDALAHEKKLISEFGRIIKGDGILTNYSDGGDKSNVGWVPSEGTRKTWSIQRRGIKQSDKHIESRVKQTTGKHRTDESKRKYLLASIRRTNPELKVKIIKAIESTTYKHGFYKELAKKLNCHHELISRIHKDINLYKEALDEWIEK
jgi:hypothetical protein